MEEDVIHWWKEVFLGEICQGFFWLPGQERVHKNYFLSTISSEVVFMAPMEVQCEIGNLTVPLDSNWPFHSSHFSTFPNGVKEELPRLWKCRGNWGTKTFLMYCEVINSRNVFSSTGQILPCGYHKEKIITCNSKSGSSCVKEARSRSLQWETKTGRQMLNSWKRKKMRSKCKTKVWLQKWNCWRKKRTR